MAGSIRLACVAVFLIGMTGAAHHATAQGSSPPATAAGDADLGGRLFSGVVRFANGGPACGACHDNAMLPRPGGGSMGPDLTSVYTRMGPQGVRTALATLYFPTMMPLFRLHPLTASEQAAIDAFLHSTTQAAPRDVAATVWLGAAGFVGVIVFGLITAFAGRSRVRSVRLALLDRVADARTR